MADGVIDLRGSPTGLEGLGEGLAALFGALRTDPNDKLREALLSNPQLANQVAMAERRRRREFREQPIDPRIGDANIEDVKTPPTAGLGIFPPEILDELLVAFPATRAEQVATARADIQTPAEEAQLTVDLQAAEAAQAELIKTEAERDKAVIDAATAAGMTPEAIGLLQVAQFNLQAAGSKLDQRGIEEFGRIYDNANPQDQRIIASGLVGQRGQAFTQALLQRERLNAEDAAARLRAQIAGARTPEEMAEARFQFKNDIRIARDRTVDRINETAEDSNRRDELPGLIEDMRDLALEMLRLDPSMAATTANEIRGIIRRNNITGAEFSITDITDSAADLIEVNAHIFADEGMSPESAEFLANDLRDPTTGRVNQRLMLAISERASQIIEGRQNDEDAARIASEGARNLMANPELITQNDRRVAELEEELETLLAQREGQDVEFGTPRRIVELTWLIRLQKLMGFFAGTGQQNRRGIPRTREEAREFQPPGNP